MTVEQFVTLYEEIRENWRYKSPEFLADVGKALEQWAEESDTGIDAGAVIDDALEAAMDELSSRMGRHSRAR